jgi:hypothetical protein
MNGHREQAGQHCNAVAVSFGAREATANWLVDLAGSVGMVHRRNQDGIDPARFEA